MTTIINNTITRLSITDTVLKRAFDLIASFLGLLLCFWIIFIAWIVASIETRSNGLFLQKRIGRMGKPFTVIKIKTMHNKQLSNSTVTTAKDQRITTSGKFFRRTKIDELPQFFNVFIGNMSFVGPRPDVSGYADTLNEDDKIILSLRPGVTGPATLKYRDEEELLANHPDPEKYNREVIYPDKVKINKDYIKNYSFKSDINYILKTIFH